MTWEIVPQDEAWVGQAKRNLTAFYENQPVERMPFEFVVHRIQDDWFDVSPKPPGDRTADQAKREFFDPEAALRSQLAGVAKQVEGGFVDDRVLSIGPLSGATGWLPEIFGCQTRWWPNRPCFPEPAFSDPKRIDTLKPDFEGSDLYQAGLEQLRFFREVVGDRIPVTMPDMQSPIDVASMITDTTPLIYAMMDDPKRVHALLRMITDATIAACRAFRREMVTDWPENQLGWWTPRGIFMSDDLMAVLNPDLYREFAVPYNEALGEEFGGVALHSCGRVLHNLENVAQTQGIFALNTHDPGALCAPILKDRVALITGGVHEHMMATHPDSRRDDMTTAEALEDFWWEDAGRLAEITGQRVYFQCHALLHRHTPEEAYERMLDLSRRMVVNQPPVP